jgi:hypothetical protein
MAIPFVTHDVARSIYEYAGTDGLPDFDTLPPTVQISYIEEAEAAIKTLCKHISFLATQVEESDVQPFIQGILNATAYTLDPSHRG